MSATFDRWWLRVGRVALSAMACACSHTDKNGSFRNVSTIEVPLRTATDHTDLINMMRQMAVENGMHLDDDSQQWMAFERSLPSKQPIDTRATIYVGVWRGTRDDDFEVSVNDMMHIGRAWVSFLHGGTADLPTSVRLKTLAEIRHRWPGAQMVPVLPSGGEPLADDLRLSPRGYKIAASSASRYGIPPSSSLLTSN